MRTCSDIVQCAPDQMLHISGLASVDDVLALLDLAGLAGVGPEICDREDNVCTFEGADEAVFVFYVGLYSLDMKMILEALKPLSWFYHALVCFMPDSRTATVSMPFSSSALAFAEEVSRVRPRRVNCDLASGSPSMALITPLP